MSAADAIKSQSQPGSLAPSSNGHAPDEKRRWEDEKASARRSDGGDDDTLDVVDYKRGVDVAVDLVAGAHAEDTLDAEAAARVRRKLDWHILPLLFALYTGELEARWWLAFPCRPRVGLSMSEHMHFFSFS